jgi:hypothetical protein
MRKSSCFVRSVVAAGLLMGVMQLGARAQLANAGFESGSGQGIPSWANWGGVGAEPWAARTGTNGFAMFGWTTGGGLYQDVASPGVSNYTFTAYGLCENQFSATLTAEMKIEFLGSNGVLLASASRTVRGGPAWALESINAVSPSGTLYVRPVLIFSGYAGSGGAYKWDDLALNSVPQAPAPGTNLLNGGMEAQANWTLAGNLRYEPWAARTGSNGLAMYGWTTDGAVYQDVATTSASNYTFSIYGYRDAGFDLAALRPIISVTFFPYAGSSQVLASASYRIDYAPESWTKYGVTATKPAGAGMVRVGLSFAGTVAGGAFKWDDATLTSGNASATTHYVSTTGGNVFPYDTWPNASRSIEAAIGASAHGDTVLVTNGTYNLLWSIPLEKSLTLRGVNGAASTIVNGAARDRCVYLTAPNVFVEGFTFTNGSIQLAGYAAGGGVYSVGAGSTLKSCVVRGNRANGSPSQIYYGGTGQGGGIYATGLTIDGCTVEGNNTSGSSAMYAGTSAGGGVWLTGGTVLNSSIRNNKADGGGGTTRGVAPGFGGGLYASGVTLSGSTIESNQIASGNYGMAVGGGVYALNSSIKNCRLLNNSNTTTPISYADPGGGGIYMSGSTAENCLITGNRNVLPGGGAYVSGGELIHCTIVSNATTGGASGTGDKGAGAYLRNNAIARNCIAYYNVAWLGQQAGDFWLESGAQLFYSCSPGNWGGVGNTLSPPSFVSLGTLDLHLAANSPCVDAAAGTSVTNDLDGAARPLDGDGTGGAQPDMGCYERAAVPPTGNPLQNAGMENSGGWIIGGDMVYEPWAARTGSRGLAMYGWTGNGGFAYQDVAATTGTYTFSAWGYRDTNFSLVAKSPALKLEFFNSSFTMLGAATNNITSAPAAWTKYSVTGNRPASATIVRVVLSFSGSVSGGAFKWDDANLVTGTVAGARAAVATEKVSEDASAPAEVTTPSAPTVAPAAPSTSEEKKPARRVRGHRGSRSVVSESGPKAIGVLTSDGKAGADGWSAVDGNASTSWVGQKGARGWWIAVTYGKSIKVRDVQVDLAEGSANGAQFLYSLDGKTWEPLSVDLFDGPVELGYLWVIFPANASGAVPNVKEIRLERAR